MASLVVRKEANWRFFVHVGTDPEMALRGTNTKFRRRFGHIEKELEAGGETLDAASLERMEELWQAAKAIERQLR